MVSWQGESCLALSCLAYNWPGEDAKKKPQQGMGNGGKKNTHVFIRKKMREGSEREQKLLM